MCHDRIFKVSFSDLKDSLFLSQKIEKNIQFFNGKKSNYFQDWINQSTVIGKKNIPNRARFQKWIERYVLLYELKTKYKKEIYYFPTDFAHYLMMDKYDDQGNLKVK